MAPEPRIIKSVSSMKIVKPKQAKVKATTEGGAKPAKKPATKVKTTKK